MVSIHLSGYLHPIEVPFPSGIVQDSRQADYFYQGYCPRTGQHHQIPRTPLAKAVAGMIMQQLQTDALFNQEGKMYGVLLVQTASGAIAFLKAFSGLLDGQAMMPGWVPPIAGREQIILQEAYTIQALEAIKSRLVELQRLPERETYAQLVRGFDQQRQSLNHRHRQQKLEREHQRQCLRQKLTGASLQAALAALEQESRGDKAELRAFKQAKAAKLDSIGTIIRAADDEIVTLKRQRQSLSRQLQTEMHQIYRLTNFAGQSLAVNELGGRGNLPTGTGDCCAPKLLHFAAEHGLTPLAMAEFWWGGTATAEKQPGKFYGACAERCQPIMGFLLSGLSAIPTVEDTKRNPPLPILYEDDWLVVVNKSAGLLSVPGRYANRQDSVLSRLKHQLPDGHCLVPVHRLDQDTSGVMVLARQKEWEGRLRQQFQARQVKKTYEAILEEYLACSSGSITLPLWGNPAERPRQSVDWQRGKPCQTQYRVISHDQSSTRVEFYPITGRTHQLRVHSSHPLGLNRPIQGDRLYGRSNSFQRLYLHARELRLLHPWHQQELFVKAVTPF